MKCILPQEVFVLCKKKKKKSEKSKASQSEQWKFASRHLCVSIPVLETGVTFGNRYVNNLEYG